MKKLKTHNHINNSRRLFYKRCMAFFLDLLFCSLIAFVLIVVSSYINPMHDNMINIVICDLPLLFAFFCKDVLKPSIGKRIMKLNIYSIKGREDIKISKLIIRNLSIVIWPVEVYALNSSNGEQRFADKKLGLIVKEM